MISAIDQYLDTLLRFVPRNKLNRFTADYIALVHVPVEGAEKVYSLVYDLDNPKFTVASYKAPVWALVERHGETNCSRPELDALQTRLAADHPVLSYVDRSMLRACSNYSDGRAGLDYYLLLWQRNGESGVVECYEPYSRQDGAWASVIGSLQVLSSQFEYAVNQ